MLRDGRHGFLESYASEKKKKKHEVNSREQKNFVKVNNYIVHCVGQLPIIFT